MRRNFGQVKQYLETHFPELRGGKITGDNYPPPAFIELLTKILSLIQLAGILMVMLGTNVFSLLGMSYVPRWYDGVQKNGIQIAILVFLVLPKVLSSYVITGAFEIILDNDIVVFSKIATGRLPSWQDLVTPLVEAGLKRAEVSEA
jgi:selT/selW/selH-like putative selenoprotein